ncbi:hypothetical protein ABH935_000663 [Catenulispora sp. GAS73]|uniref:hypothetical protein n=1 Tax=Catenulispora sp. GAS73 TaxID=3156269 RepID=UPI003518F786
MQAIFNGSNPRAEWVDLRHLQSIQKTIDLGRFNERLESAGRDEAGLIGLCLPSQLLGTQIAMAPDLDRRAITFASTNQNLRVQQFGCQGSTVNMALGMGAPHVTVAHCEGRYFLQDGYHRATGLLQPGVTVVPAIVIDVPSYASIAGPSGGFSIMRS